MSNEYAEKIFRGGPILTMDDAHPQVEAVAIAGGRIIAAGDETEVMNSCSDATMIIDLNGNTLMPSFIDAHGHFMNAPQIVKWANLSGLPVGPVACIADIITVLKAHVEKFQLKPGEWILGYGYDVATISIRIFLTIR
jgi:predicted amidohydrolase YtcJ